MGRKRRKLTETVLLYAIERATLFASIASAEGAPQFGEGKKNANDEELHMFDFILAF